MAEREGHASLPRPFVITSGTLQNTRRSQRTASQVAPTTSVNKCYLIKSMEALSRFDLESRAAKFESQSQEQLAREQRRLQKEQILQQRAAARREAHDRAVEELRRRQAEEAEQVRGTGECHCRPDQCSAALTTMITQLGPACSAPCEAELHQRIQTTQVRFVVCCTASPPSALTQAA